ncbi:FUSC family protein [Campylobacter porcelli]|uniref:FUSC family protein n=1 Tax=Campylobacter porcelli TaxID=1660073 RepID=A0A1X9SW13_9BACT|nr:FUSC family protein [Campylobacter sp. RM6137]ARR00431.1 integral membrane protein, YccS/YhfK family [Campylobacter sp. RM6137]MEE3703971.1 FUSC family protein [Campylobacter sp. CX2-8023-23]MEE3744857.1 FUSC family protein [Campylobacter sp. CX2-4855-23]MEE3775874.1 FUSC family protein [Campylobacter sp. CX2-4080-23]
MDKIAKFFKYYDPAWFALSYSIKATISILICGFIGYYIGGFFGMVYAASSSMSIFFLSSLEGNIKIKISYFVIYIILGICSVLFVNALFKFHIIFCFFTLIWMIFVGFSNLFNQNLNKILSIVNATGLLSIIASNQPGWNLQDSLGGFVASSIIAATFRLTRFGTYGKFTKRSCMMILDELVQISQNINNDKEFLNLSKQCNEHINDIKNLFANKSSTIKDERLIIHHSRAIFYLYKLEDIYNLLISMQRYFKTIKNPDLLNLINSEIIRNLIELKNIFIDKNSTIKDDALNIARQSDHTIFTASLEVLYSKFHLIKDGGEDKITLEYKKQKSIKEIIKDTTLHNPTIQYSLRLAIGVSIAIIIASFIDVHNGVWIAIGVISMSKDSSYMTKITGIANIKGAIIGIALTSILINLISNNSIFAILCVISIFLAFYLKNFPPIYAMGAFMGAFAMAYSLILGNSMEMVYIRIIDILIGFIVSFGVAFMLFRHTNEIKLSNTYIELLPKFKKLSNSVIEGRFTIEQNEILNSLTWYHNTITQSDRSKELKRYLEIYRNLYDISSLLSNLKVYTQWLNHPSKPNGAKDALISDINIISTRFEMIEKRVDKLPYYFYDNMESRILSQDKKIRFLLLEIAKRQDRIIAYSDLLIR